MKKVFLIATLFFSFLITSFSQTVKIGKQEWMTKNLRVTTFKNGDIIPQAKTDEEWKMAGINNQPVWCYNNEFVIDTSKSQILYNWYAVSDPRGLAPQGYHIPSDDEWKILFDFLGGKAIAGAKLKSKEGWPENGNGSNSSGFNGLPDGARKYHGNLFDKDQSAWWWSSTLLYSINAWVYVINYDSNELIRAISPLGGGLSVRCIKD